LSIKLAMLVSSVQAVVACYVTAPRVCTLVLFIYWSKTSASWEEDQSTGATVNDCTVLGLPFEASRWLEPLWRSISSSRGSMSRSTYI